MNILSYISLPIFFISFAIGIFFVYIFGTEKKKIYIYPSPENINKILFKDKANNCFTFKEEQIECPQDETLISSIPIQT
jgi:hypothetical protein